MRLASVLEGSSAGPAGFLFFFTSVLVFFNVGRVFCVGTVSFLHFL